MQILRTLAAVVLAGGVASSTAYAEVRLSIDNGRVSLTAKDATVRQILAEWARVGQTKIVNAERVPGGPLTLELKNMPEEQALDLLLRSVSGFLAAPRPVMIANASRFDRVIVMPTAAAARVPTSTAPIQQPTFNPPPFQPAVVDDTDDEPANIPVPIPNPRGPVFNAFPQPQIVNPQVVPSTMPGFPQQDQQEGTRTPAPRTTPGAVSVPGMIVPPQVPQPGQVDPRRQGER